MVWYPRYRPRAAKTGSTALPSRRVERLRAEYWNQIRKRARLAALAEQISGTAPAVSEAQSAIEDAGNTPLHRSFYRAMSMNLAYLGRL
jgi:hypothetical protein